MTKYKVMTAKEAMELSKEGLASIEFSKDLEGQYENIFVNLSKMAEIQYNKHFSVKAQHLLFFVDADGDGMQDSNVDNTAINPLLVTLIKHAYVKASESTSNKKAIDLLKDFANEFNKQPRIVSYKNYEYDKDTHKSTLKDSNLGLSYSEIAQLRKVGFGAKFEDLNQITNVDVLTEKAKFVPKFNELVKKVYSEQGEKLTDEYVLYKSDEITGMSSDVSDEYLDLINTKFGWHLLLVKKGDKVKSAKASTQDKDLLKIKDKNGKELSYVNDKDYVSPAQVEIYLKAQQNSEYKLEKYLPSSIINAIKEQTQPLISRYSSGAAQSAMINNLLGTITFTNETETNKYNAQKEINKFTLNDNLHIDDTVEYKELWGQWSELFK